MADSVRSRMWSIASRTASYSRTSGRVASSSSWASASGASRASGSVTAQLRLQVTAVPDAVASAARCRGGRWRHRREQLRCDQESSLHLGHDDGWVQNHRAVRQIGLQITAQSVRRRSASVRPALVRLLSAAAVGGLRHAARSPAARARPAAAARHPQTGAQRIQAGVIAWKRQLAGVAWAAGSRVHQRRPRSGAAAADGRRHCSLVAEPAGLPWVASREANMTIP
jgi:hypothetical protein